jgi:membrane associated rhomboid family serine protease
MRNNKITIMLISVNIIVYFYQVYLRTKFPEAEFLFMLDNAISNKGQLKTLVTNMFIHKDIFHIGMNMMGLYFLGSYIEGTMKEKKYFILYFASGLIASLVSFLYVKFIDPQLVIGASGAIFGLWAYYSLYRNEFKEFLLIAGITNLAMIFGGLPIAWYAHLGGSIAGIIIWKLERKAKKQTIFKL